MQELFNECVDLFNFGIQSHIVKHDHNQVIGLGSTDKDSGNNKKPRKQESHESDHKEHSNVKPPQEMKVNNPTPSEQLAQP